MIEGDSRQLLQLGPFDLLFADGGGKEPEWGDHVIDSLRKPGGILVLDDMMWGRALEMDPVKSFWLQHPRLVATEVMAGAPDWAAIICVRREI